MVFVFHRLAYFSIKLLVTELLITNKKIRPPSCLDFGEFHMVVTPLMPPTPTFSKTWVVVEYGKNVT